MIRLWGWLTTLLIVGLVLFIGIDLLVRGWSGFGFDYLFGSPENLGRDGGIWPILVSTAIIVLSATLIAGVFAMATAVTYTESIGPKWFRLFVHAVLDIGVGVPRIVWGLFGGVFFCEVLGWGFSILSGIATLACLLAPILTTGFIAGLEEVDERVRDACRALGVSPWITLWKQILPAARPACIAALALAVARGFGDAAALLFTAGIATGMPDSVYDSAATLAVFVFNLLTAVPGGQSAAYSAAAILFLLTFAVQLVIAGTQRKQGLAT